MAGAITVERFGGASTPNAESTSAVALHFRNRGHGLEFEMEARWIASQVPRDARSVVDLGCGIGALFSYLGLERSIGVDLSEDGLRLTRIRFPRVPLITGSAEAPPLRVESTDVIVMQHVVEHLRDFDRSASAWYRALRPGGRLVIVTPNADFVDPTVYDDPTHTHIFDRHDLRDALRRAGFEIRCTKTLGLPWFRRPRALPGVWRLRRLLIGWAAMFGCIPGLRGRGQSLCCVARRPIA